MINGGAETNRGSPSTSVVSLPKAWMLSRWTALSSSRSSRLRILRLTRALSSGWSRSSSKVVYQTSRFGIEANSRIRERYSAAVSSTARS